MGGRDSRLTGRCLFAIVIAWSAPAGLPAQTVIPAAVSCAACTISATPMVRLGSESGAGAFPLVPRRVLVDGKGRYWVATGAEPFVFAASGRFVAAPIRKGDGPGELPFGGVPIAALPGDSVLVLDGDRGLILDGGLKTVRAVSAPRGIGRLEPVQWPRMLFATGNIQSRELIGWPIHTVDASKATFALLNSASPTGERVTVGDFSSKIAVRGTELWSVLTMSYTLVHWDSKLRRVQGLQRRPDWWKKPSTSMYGTRDQAPQPYVAAIHFDDEGLLWVFIQRPRSAWREAWKRVPANAVELREGVLDDKLLHEAIVEVIDVAAARVVTRANLGRYVVSALPGRRVAAVAETPSGAPMIAIIALSLNGR